MSSLHDLTLISISYNSAEIIAQHIDSLDLPTIPENQRPKWIVVDNDSHDQTPQLLAEKYPHVTVIANKENVGFGSAGNQGIAAATTRFVMILNPDTILSHTALSSMLQELQADDKAAIAGPNVTDHPMTGIESVNWIVGAAMMMDTAKMDSYGYFDEGFFLYYEETDLCIRTIKEGYRILHCNNAHIPHAEGESSTRTDTTHYFLFWHMGRSYARICAKHPEKFAPLTAYLKKQRRRLFITYLTRNKKRHLSTKAKIDGATAAATQPVNKTTFSLEKPS